MNKKFIIISAFCIAAFSAFFYFASTKKTAAQFGAMPTPEVAVMRIESKETELFEELPGRVVALKTAQIRPQIGGIIKDIKFVEGGFVEQNQQLYQIEDSNYQANYSGAKAQLSRSQANLKTVEAKYKRYQELLKIEAVSKQEFDDLTALFMQAKADLVQAQANLDKAKIDLDYTKVFAPISGQIGISSATQGALVSANQAEILTTITQLDPIYIDINQQSQDLIKLREKIAKHKELETEIEISGKKITGKLQSFESIVDASTNSVKIRTIFDNPDKTLLPGLFVRVKIKFPKENLITIPQSAASYNPDGSVSVWVMDDKNIVSPRNIKTLQSLENRWVVESGLNINDIIVVEGFQKIKPETKVSPVYLVEEKNN